MWAVVGLGNPGRRYARTRHNAGFVLVDRLARKKGARLRKRAYLSRSALIRSGHDSVLLVKPWTFMNEAGKAVKALIEKTGLPLDHLVVVYDDLDLFLGEIRVRSTGSPGTHKGMISVVNELGSVRFPRIRIGIGPLPPEADATDFVLSDFSEPELARLEEGLGKAEDALDLVLQGRIEEAMDGFNRRMRRTGQDEAGETEKSG